MKLNNYDVFNRHQITFDVVIKLLSPLSHIGESVGNQSNLKTLTITDLEGKPNEVFVYSGNALRNGVLRRRGVASFLNQLNINVKPEIHQTLFAGGYIDGGTACDLELDKKIRQLLPCLSVLGSAKPKGLLGGKDAQMIGGRLNIGDAVLVCYESAEYIYKYFPPSLPAEVINPLGQIIEAKEAVTNDRIESWLHNKKRTVNDSDYRELLREWQPFLEDKLRPYTQWLTWNQKVRMDSLKDSNLQKHLSSSSVTTGQLSLLGDDKPKEKDKKVTQQMIMGDWLIQQGATLYSRCSGFITDIEEGFISDAWLDFANSPYIGGKSGTGCGLVQVDIYYQSQQQSGHWLHISPSSQIVSDRCSENHVRYLDYLEDYKQYITDIKSDVRGFLGL